METDEELLSDMIILGLSWKAKDEDVHDYFSRFGELDYYEVSNSSFAWQPFLFFTINIYDHD